VQRHPSHVGRAGKEFLSIEHRDKASTLAHWCPSFSATTNDPLFLPHGINSNLLQSGAKTQRRFFQPGPMLIASAALSCLEGWVIIRHIQTSPYLE
jgi:hypothetical protein